MRAHGSFLGHVMLLQVWARSRLVGQKSTPGPMYVFATPISALTNQMQQFFMLCLFSSFASPGQGLAFQIQHGGWHPTPAWLAFRASDHTQPLPPTEGEGRMAHPPTGGAGGQTLVSRPGPDLFWGGRGGVLPARHIYIQYIIFTYIYIYTIYIYICMAMSIWYL